MFVAGLPSVIPLEPATDHSVAWWRPINEFAGALSGTDGSHLAESGSLGYSTDERSCWPTVGTWAAIPVCRSRQLSRNRLRVAIGQATARIHFVKNPSDVASVPDCRSHHCYLAMSTSCTEADGANEHPTAPSSSEIPT
jgi:carbohydrate-selective porin OprB